MPKDFQESLRELKADLEGYVARQGGLQKQVDAIDLTLHDRDRSYAGRGGGRQIKDVTDAMERSSDFEMLRKNGRGRAIIQIPNLLEIKTVTSGSLTPYQHEAAIADSGRKRYRLRSLIPSVPIDVGSAHFVRETAFTDAASPQVEASEKSESNISLEAATAGVKTIATWCGVSKQVLDDLAEMGLFIEGTLKYGLEREFEEQCLNGDNTGENFDGLTGQATAFDSSLLVASDGWEYVDVLRLAALQLELAGHACTGFVVSPTVWARIELQKASDGQYINRSPAGSALQEVIWNRIVIPSPAIGANSFLAGDFAGGCHLRMRQESTIDISDSHSDYFTRNLLAIRAELRAAFVVSKPSAFVAGTFSQSPA